MESSGSVRRMVLSLPIQRLVEGTDEISRGNLDYKIDVTSKDEIGELTEAFKRMAGNLRFEQILFFSRQYIEVLNGSDFTA